MIENNCQHIEIELKSLNDLQIAYTKAIDEAIEKFQNQDKENDYTYEYCSYRVSLIYIDFNYNYDSNNRLATAKFIVFKI